MLIGYCKCVVLTVLLCGLGIASARDNKPAAHMSQGSPYLFVWGGDAANKATDFLTVISVDPASSRYGQTVATVPVGVSGTMPHHTEYEFPATKKLFANGWVSGRTFIFDLNDPLKPSLAGQFRDEGGYSFPHSFVRLPDGNLLGTFQSHSEGYRPGGGLVEVDEQGKFVRSASAVDPAVDKDLIWPYSLAVDSKRDLVVSSSTPMGWPDWKPLPSGSWPLKKINDQVTAQVQIWRLSDLKLLKTITLTDSDGKHNQWPAEPRLLPDGSLYVNTFSCGLYLLKNPNDPNASAEKVYTFPGNADSMDSICSVPVVVGHFWIQTAAALPGLVVLDVSDPEKPVEVSRLVLGKQFNRPHWIAADRKSNRLVVTGNDQEWLLILRLEPEKGTLSIDQSFHAPGSSNPGISFENATWPDGRKAPTAIHGALFGP